VFNTFRGGIHPPQRKTLTENSGIENLSVPQICYIPMLQHMGVPAEPVVKIGDIIREGELIGAARGNNSANVHAAVPGKVIDIAEELTDNGRQTTIVIEAEGAFTTTGSSAAINDWNNIDKTDLLNIVRDCGIVGLGGAALPTAETLSPPPEKHINTLIVNGAESEPYLTVDDLLMRTYPGEIIEGIKITLKIIGIKKAVIAVEDNKKTAIKLLKEALKKSNQSGEIILKQLRTKYPQESEKQLIYSTLNKVVPSSGQAVDAGVIVQNVGTIYAIREAVLFYKPLIDRYLTISGKMINRPGNYKVRIGTKISDIVEECGGLKGTPSKIVIGGPMCGISVDTMEIPVTKGTSGILFLSDDEVRPGDFSSCIRCGRCVSVCPMGLIPCRIAGAVERERFDLASELHADTCIMCSSCSYVCPAKRPLSNFVRIAQENMSQQK